MQYSKPKEPLGSFILKIAVVVIIIIIGAIILFGFVWQGFDPVNFIINAIGVILMLFLLGLAVKGILSFLKPKPYSPTEDFRTQLIRICIKLKPFNVYNLYLRGEDMRTRAIWGKIIGLGFLPYVSSKPLKDNMGKWAYERDHENKIVMERKWSDELREFVKVPKILYEKIIENDGDVLFIVRKHNFPMNVFMRDVDIVRANKKLTSDLVGDVFIKDVNLVPYGEFLYPAKQWQRDILKIMKENESSAIAMTHRNNLDLVSQTTQMSLGVDPTFQKIMMAQSERLSSGLGQAGGA
jgi:hypothetical protein